MGESLAPNWHMMGGIITCCTEAVAWLLKLSEPYLDRGLLCPDSHNIHPPPGMQEHNFSLLPPRHQQILAGQRAKHRAARVAIHNNQAWPI